MADDADQEILDTFYFSKGPCCAGCDWWRHWNALTGECVRHAPRPAPEVHSCLYFEGSNSAGGHPVTSRDYHCGDFKDEFDWSTLPLPYRKRVGAPV